MDGGGRLWSLDLTDILFQPFMESLVDKERPGEEILHIFYDGVKMMVRRQESWESEDFDFLKSENFFETLMTIFPKDDIF